MTIASAEKVMGKFSFSRGVHPPHHKELTEKRAIRQALFNSGDRVVVPMSQHLGVPCQPTVQAKEEVKAGQMQHENIFEVTNYPLNPFVEYHAAN